jgi:hypothetical protein
MPFSPLLNLAHLRANTAPHPVVWAVYAFDYDLARILL